MQLMRCIAGLGAFILSAGAWAGSDIRLTDLRGEVQVKNAAGAIRTASANEAVIPGESVLTGADSQVVLKFEDGHVIALKDNTDFAVRSYRYEANAPAQNSMLLSLVKGGLRSLTGLLGRANKQSFELRTPTATIGIRGSDWMAALQNNSLYTGVNSGGIVVNNTANSLLINAGQYSASLGSNASQLVSFSQLPVGVFGSLPQLSLGGVAAGTTGGATGSAAGGVAGGAASGVSVGAVAVGVATAGLLSAVAGDDNSATSHSTTTHH